MDILKHFNSDKLHHAYLIEGEKEKIIPVIFQFLQSLKININNNPDFYHLSIDSLKIEDARNLKSLTLEKSVNGTKKIFLITINNFLLEAQNTLLKIFEEPIADTHFFVILPDADILLKTLFSRFYFIKASNNLELEKFKIKNFLQIPLKEKIDFVKELIKEEDIDEEKINESSRSKALKFLNALEKELTEDISKIQKNIIFEHLLKVREFLRQPGSSTKTLLESVAIIVSKS